MPGHLAEVYSLGATSPLSASGSIVFYHLLDLRPINSTKTCLYAFTFHMNDFLISSNEKNTYNIYIFSFTVLAAVVIVGEVVMVVFEAAAE